MFTGLVEEVGTVIHMKKSTRSAHMTIKASKVLEDVHLGDSIAINGICLTVTAYDRHTFTVDAMPETMDKTNLRYLSLGNGVHLERAMAVGDRFGGHIVTGHIDGMGKISKHVKEENATRLTVTIDKNLSRYMIDKGSVAVDGVSLTIAAVQKEAIEIGIIPMTGQETLLLKKRVGDHVNIECDVLGKYVEQLCNRMEKAQEQNSSINKEFLSRNGFI